MAAGLPFPSPLWRSGLRIWLASTLTIGILLWSGRGEQVGAGLVIAVTLVSDGLPIPARNIGQLVAGALIGILTAFVLHELSTSWVMLALALLLTGLLIRGLGLLQGLSVGYVSCWALDLMHQGNQVNWALIFNLSFAAVVGILMAQLASWALWPQRPLQQLPAVEEAIANRVALQIRAMRQWLGEGGSPPPPLRSQELLPHIQLLQQLHDQRQGLPRRERSSAAWRLQCRWIQAGSLWRQLLRQWLLLEPLLRQLPAPLPAQASEPLLLDTLAELAMSLERTAGPAGQRMQRKDPQRWLDQAYALAAAQPLLLAIGQQCQALQQLTQARQLLHGSIGRLSVAE